MSFGIDVYRAYQDVRDWRAVRSAGVEFCYVKVSDGTAHRSTGNYFADAKAQGIKVGGYHYAEPGNAVAQANLLVDIVETLGATDLAPALDLESPFVPGATARNFAVAFVRQVKARGHRPCLYASDSMMSSIRAAVLAAVPECIIWVARYGANPVNPYHVWQYSQSGRIPGISASGVDLDTGSIPLNTLTASARSTSPGGIEEMAFNDSFTDWANNKQTVLSWMNHVDQRVATIAAALENLQAGANSVQFGEAGKRSAGDVARVLADVQTKVTEIDKALDNLNAGADSVQFGVTGKRNAGDLARTVYDIQQTLKAVQTSLSSADQTEEKAA